MAKIKIIGRREPIEIDNEKARAIKRMRFGDLDGNGKVDPKEDIDLGDEWAGKIGQIDWIELDKSVKPAKVKFIHRPDQPRVAIMVPIDYQLKEGETNA